MEGGVCTVPPALPQHACKGWGRGQAAGGVECGGEGAWSGGGVTWGGGGEQPRQRGLLTNGKEKGDALSALPPACMQRGWRSCRWGQVQPRQIGLLPTKCKEGV